MKRILSLLSIFLFILSFAQKAEINAKILFPDGTVSDAKILFRKSILITNHSDCRIVLIPNSIIPAIKKSPVLYGRPAKNDATL